MSIADGGSGLWVLGLYRVGDPSLRKLMWCVAPSAIRFASESMSSDEEEPRMVEWMLKSPPMTKGWLSWLSFDAVVAMCAMKVFLAAEVLIIFLYTEQIMRCWLVFGMCNKTVMRSRKEFEMSRYVRWVAGKVAGIRIAEFPFANTLQFASKLSSRPGSCRRIACISQVLAKLSKSDCLARVEHFRAFHWRMLVSVAIMIGL